MNDKRILSINEKISILFSIIIDIIERNNLKKATKINLSNNQFLILKILDATGPKYVHEIANVLNISAPAASKNIDFLVENRLLSRKMITFDRRKVKLMLRDKGKSFLKKYYNISNLKMQSIINNLNTEDKIMLNIALDNFIFACLKEESDLSIFCLKCGGKYEGCCPIAKKSTGCYFNISKS